MDKGISKYIFCIYGLFDYIQVKTYETNLFIYSDFCGFFLKIKQWKLIGSRYVY